MLHSYSIHSFKTLDSLVKYIYGLIEDAYEELDIDAVTDWFTNSLSFDEEVGKYIAYIDSFIDGDLKVADKVYNAINKAAGNDLDANANKVDNAYDKVMVNLTEEEQNVWQINGFLEDLDNNLAKLDNKSFITIAYIDMTDDGHNAFTLI